VLVSEQSRKVLRVVLADDHYLVREGTRQLLELGGEIEVVASVASVDELLRSVEETHPDVVVTDIRMPPTHRLEGIEAAHALRVRYPDLGVVVLSNHAQYEYALELFREGTTGLAYLLKDRVGDRAELLRAIYETADGGSVVDPVVVEALVTRGGRPVDSPLRDLTVREREVLEQMAAGRVNAAIAELLHLSVSAVEKNVNSIFAKLGLGEERSTHRRVAAVVTYLAEGEDGR
jgi:DNA-binding NarL/FixJ family response regulator